MATFFRFLGSNPTLVPLFGAVGLGLTAGGAMCYHYLANSPDVIVSKKKDDHPWNRVSQETNTKFTSYNPDFWRSRVGMLDPRRHLVEDTVDHHEEVSNSLMDKIREARAKARKAEI